MSEELTLPGAIPGLLRRGSPVLLDLPGHHLHGHPGTVHAVRGDEAWVAVDGCETVLVIKLSSLLLDLTDATGRAHAAWWLMGLPYGGPSPIRRIASPLGSASGIAVYLWPQDAGYASARVPGHPVGMIVPTLADLDPDDPRLLPDGSRWVDAEALRRVALRVWGGR